jgi:MFS family permease
MAVVKYWVPDQPPPLPAAGPRAAGLRRALEPELLRLNAGIFILHVILYAMFVVVPPLFVRAGLPLAEHWKLYLPVVLASFVLMIPGVIYADRKNRPKRVLLASVALLVLVQGGLAALDAGLLGLVGLMLAFFAAFNVLESILPALVSRAAPAQGRGAAIGVYNTTQTLGVFFGGLLGGWAAMHFGAAAVFWVCCALACAWLLVAAGMRPLAVNQVSTLTFSIGAGVELGRLREALAEVQGVREAEVLPQERIAHLKVDAGQWDESKVRKLITGEV